MPRLPTKRICPTRPARRQFKPDRFQPHPNLPPTSTAIFGVDCEMGMVYVSVASSPTTSMPSTKLRMSALRSGNVPSCKKSRKSATYRAISSVLGSSTLLWSSWVSASSLAASSCSSRCLREKMRGDTSNVSSLVSMAS